MNWSALVLPAGLGLFAAAACNERLAPLPTPRSSPPLVSGHRFRAGFGRVNITPPPGVGLSGNGPEGKRSAGYRVHLYARAMVLEDSAGERVAYVIADLPHLSANLHRLTADRISLATGIGADRLILAATHGHAGPGHHYGERGYNENASSVSGYDPAVVEFFVARFANAIRAAVDSLRPARVAWGAVPVWGQTRNRSYEAFLRNKPGWAPPYPEPSGLDPPRGAVDPTWTMVRVDIRGSGADTTYYPAGALSTFAIHGTGNPPDNDLLDGDIHELVARGLERHIDSQPPFPRRVASVALFANGSEGDVSPDWPEQARCGMPTFEAALDLAGPRSPAARWRWTPPPAQRVAMCAAAARAYMAALSDVLTRHAAALFDSLGNRLTDSVTLGVAFRNIPHLKGYRGLCQEAEVGLATVGGAEDGRTRMFGWRAAGVLPLRMVEGGDAARPNPAGCQREKRSPPRLFRLLLVGLHGLPESAQFTVVRLGSLILAAVPAEVTTVAGSALKHAMRDSGEANGLRVDHVALIGLANGYLQYVTTDAEYGAQHYEGGSTLFGPRTAAMFAEELGSLAATLARSGGASPPSQVDTLWAYPGKPSAVMPRPYAGPPAERITRRVVRLTCAGDTVTVMWIDLYPGRLVPADGRRIVIQADRNGVWEAVAWDDDPLVEVRTVRPRGRSGYLWEARWARGSARAPIRVILLEHSSLPMVESQPCSR